MGENRHTKQDLRQLQALPLKLKIRLTQQRIREWVNEYGVDGVYVSFSGGKDSSVLLHIARQMYPEIKAAFSNTGIEFPEIVKFVNTFSNVDIVRPKMPFVEVVKKYGYPMISKEVSECVSGARKYLNSVIEEQNSKLKRSEQRCIYCGELLGKKGCLGMCNKHYIQYKRWGDPLHADKKERATIDGYYRDGKTGRREHRVIWENHYGVKLKKDEIIHHINFVKTDNRIENLYKYDNASEHIKAHRQFERLMDSLADNEEIYFENGEYIKRESSDRQKWHYQKYRQLCGLGEYEKTNWGEREQVPQTAGNRKLRYQFEAEKMFGIGRYGKQFRSARKQESGGGGEVRRFSLLTGILTSENVIDARLWENHRQFASPKNDGNQSEGRQGNDGDYP